MQGKPQVCRPVLRTTIGKFNQKLTSESISEDSVRRRREEIASMRRAAEEQCRLAMQAVEEEEATLQDDIDSKSAVRIALVALQAASLGDKVIGYTLAIE